MAAHGKRGSRSLVAGAVVALVALLVLVWAGWNWFTADRSGRSAADAAACPSGDLVLRVAVTPSAEQPVRAAARLWNAAQGAHAVDGHCARVDVVSVESARALAGLTGEWDTRALGDRPDAWLPESTLWTDRLTAFDDSRIAAAPESVATSPVVLAAPEAAARILHDAARFQWSELGDLTSDTSGWTRFGQPWGRITVALPKPVDNTASVLAVQATLTKAAQASPVTQPMLTQPAVAGALTGLANSQPADVPTTTSAALARLGEAPDVGTAPYTGVAALEVDLHRRNMALDSMPPAKQPLAELVPDGPTPTADFPYVVITEPAETEAPNNPGQPDTPRSDAANRFRQYLQEPDQQVEFGRAGLRAARSTERPAKSIGMTWDPTTPGFAKSDARTTQQLTTTWSAAVEGGTVTTILVDVSRSMSTAEADGRSRLDWVKEALHGYVDYTVSGSVGLWPFSHDLSKGKPYEVAVPTGPVGNRRAEFHTAVNGLAASGNTDFYETVTAAYRTAVQTYVPGRRNQIVVITDGGTDGAMSLSQAKSAIHRVADKTKPVTLTVIGIGRAPDRSYLRDLTATTGGTLTPLPDARGVAAALDQAVTANP
ncbi:VWA domain-containing protein [Actinokineospora enzanensis]|uniref:VWA domain-containing protein n=1 Tax=Actinokineospora enzanensis TaxID=155975 RepID=UPI00037F339F|nr:VWA domain-containing protein [Actinokineospora enzanensis]